MTQVQERGDQKGPLLPVTQQLGFLQPAWSPHPATSESALSTLAELLWDTQGNSSKRQEVIWLAWNFIKLWVELDGGTECLS